MSSPSPADQAERNRAIHERNANVIVDAAAGTGKTTLLVSRLLHLIAPKDDGPAFAMDRVAAITFTRKAAGELKLRLRERLLAELGDAELSVVRRRRLATAIELLDNAMISTVHSFADRLLRLRPVDAQLSPAYEIAEDSAALIEQTFAQLLALSSIDELSVRADPIWREARDTVRLYQGAGLLTRSIAYEWTDRLGLDAFVRDVIETRDREVLNPLLEPPDFQALQRAIAELDRLVQELDCQTVGTRRLRSLHGIAQRLARETDPAEALRLANFWAKDLRRLKDLKKGEDFPNDDKGWDLCRWLLEGTRGKGRSREERPAGPLGDAIVCPMFEHIAKRLVRMRQAILQQYEELKRERGLVDHIDLLIKLRDLLRDDLSARSFYQSKLDHIMVDEFQDTDPLQAEIVMYLCEARASARAAQEVELQPGKLTIVGDPKQSIYRFRRADITTYAAVCEMLRKSHGCEAQLRVNFRSAAKIIDWLNEGFDEVLGPESEGPRFDSESGTVRNVMLVAGRFDRPDDQVHILPFGSGELKAEPSRDLEGEALAHYLRYLVEDSDLEIPDPRSQELRRPGYGDIAIMMIATQTVHHLTSELDRIGVPHVVRGGTLFMQDPLHQHFILGLRALADPGDGVARAALRRPPFFAITLGDLALARLTDQKSEALQSTERHIERLRRERHQHTPGEVARRVLETTGFGRYVAASVNGPQRLARLYELCIALDELARTNHLDFDNTTAVARTWLDTPPRIEAPLPIDADAIQVITAHQAKGLEWPIVALWDGRASWTSFLPQTAFTVEALTGQWALHLDGLKYDLSDRDLRKHEKKLREAERKRVVYVAATRARHVLIIPEAGEPSKDTIAGTLIQSASTKPHRVVPYKREGAPDAWWSSQSPVSVRPLPPTRPDLSAAWQAAAARAMEPQLQPAAISVVAHAVREDVREADEQELLSFPARQSRFGPTFGTTVHRALELMLGAKLCAQEATARAVREHALASLAASVLEDVTRTYATLDSHGLLRHARALEYPIAGSVDPQTLVSGVIDLLVDAPDGLCVIDFKTDAAPRADVHLEYPAYVAQVRAYAMLLDRAGAKSLAVARSGLLFTADGSLRWV